MSDAPPPQILEQWRRWSGLPAGRLLFSRLAGLTVPYAGSIPFRVEAIEPGLARVRMKDRRRVRNHLRSLHAVALISLGELTANLALMSLQPASARWIVTGLEVVYAKKARGTIDAVCRLEENLDWAVEATPSGRVELVDREGETVARLVQHWKTGPRPRKA